MNLKVSLGRLLKMNISQFHKESIWSKGQDKAPPFVTNTHERWAGAGWGTGAGRGALTFQLYFFLRKRLCWEELSDPKAGLRERMRWVLLLAASNVPWAASLRDLSLQVFSQY